MESKQLILGIIILVVLVLILYFIIGFPPRKLTWKEWDQVRSAYECEANGGIWHSWSFWQDMREECDLPYPDAGNECNDSTECEGPCLFTGENPVVNSSAMGQCAGWISVSCVNHHYFVEDGKITEEMCIE